MRYYDLSHPIESDMPIYPDDPEVRVDSIATVEEDGYRVSAIRCGSHSGTHIDAPGHTEPDGRTIDDHPVERFVFDARLVDVSQKRPREAITTEDLPDSTTTTDLLVFRTDWSERWGDRLYNDHPYLTSAAAKRCTEVGCSVAIDALNIDPTPTDRADENEPEGLPAHRELLGADRLIIENLTDLAHLPEQFVLLAFPLKLRGADGAPVRALAVVDE